jgi:tRNA(Ile)-lysidine synthase TilS/MesJ
MYLCREHFQEDVQRKAREYLRHIGLFSRGRRILIELDGGRNSCALAYMLRNIFHRRRDIELQAVAIDEGKGNAQSLIDAVSVAERLDIILQHRKIPPAQDGETSSASPSFRRREALLSVAREKDAGIIATGEDLDDVALKIFLAYLQGECGREAAEVGRHWIQPLQRIPKREVRLYALILNLGSDRTPPSCPDQLHEQARRQLYEFECRHPGTNYSLLKGWERLLTLEGGRRAKTLSKDME